MEGNWFSSTFSGTKDKGDASSASTPNVTKIVSISIVLFAAITQVLAAIGAISLSTTRQVTIWLVAGGLIVLLSIADMACRAYVTANTYRFGELSQAPPELSDATVTRPAEQELLAAPPELSDATVTRPAEQAPPEAPRVIPTEVPGTRKSVSKNGNAGDDALARQNGPRLPVDMKDVFPRGCYLVPASISETYDYDEKNNTRRQAVDEITGQRVFQCRVVDMDPERKGHSRETEVKIVADQMPVPPTQSQYGAVEFEGLTAIPYATDRRRAAYASLRATGIRQAVIHPAPEHAT